jgi:hypothetical protein
MQRIAAVLGLFVVSVIQPDYAQGHGYYMPQQGYYGNPQQMMMQPGQTQYVELAVPPPAPAMYSNVYDAIRLVQPPSPLMPPCPRGYTCCDGIKHYDPHGSMSCCGAQAYMPSAQFCSDGAVVDLVPAEPPPAPAPPPIYVQKVTLVCEGIRWEVPYPNYQCCGPSVYNVAKETCSEDGLIEARTAPPPTTTTTTEVPTRLLICQGHRFLIPAYDYQFYACCSNDPYFWPRESCVNGAVSPARPSTTTTSATPQEVQVLLVCDGVQHWIPSTERMSYGCCGQDLYDVRTDICRPPISPSGVTNNNTPTACATGYICCENYPPVLNSNNNLQCCAGVGPYDPSTSRCPPAVGRKKRSAEEKEEKKE